MELKVHDPLPGSIQKHVYFPDNHKYVIKKASAGPIITLAPGKTEITTASFSY